MLQLQRMAGNRAVQRLLEPGSAPSSLAVRPANDHYEQEADAVASAVVGGGNFAPTKPSAGPAVRRSLRAAPVGVQRKMKFWSDTLYSSEGFGSKLGGLFGQESAFSKIKRLLRDYEATNKASEEVSLLEALSGLADHWAAKHQHDESKHVRGLISVMHSLGFAARQELPKARRQAQYMTDVEQGSTAFDYLSMQARQFVPGQAKGLAQGQANPVIPGQGQAALDVVKKYHLTDAEIAAIKIYTVDDYKYINPALAGIDSWLKSNISDIKGAKSTDDSPQGVTRAKQEGLRHGKEVKKGLKKLPDYQGELYRGLTLDPAALQGQYQPGMTLTYPNFTSTSKARSESEEFIVKQGNKDKAAGLNKVGVLLILDVTHKGKDVSMLSLVQKEQEVLLLPGTRFSITAVEPGPGYTIVRAMQLPNVMPQLPAPAAPPARST